MHSISTSNTDFYQVKRETVRITIASLLSIPYLERVETEIEEACCVILVKVLGERNLAE